MKTSVALLSAAVAGLLYAPVRADEPRAAVRSGGPFEVAVTRDSEAHE